MDRITAFQMGCDSGVASIKALKALLPDPLWGDDETEESREIRNLLLNVQTTLDEIRNQIKDVPYFSNKDMSAVGDDSEKDPSYEQEKADSERERIENR